MTEAELDAAKIAEDMRKWHQLNRDAPQAKASVKLLKQAIQSLEEAERYLLRAADAVEHTPECDRILSIECGTEDIETAVRGQVERMK